MTDRLRVVSASKAFGDREALRGVNLALGANELLALVGPNGAGKTTLIRAICGRTRLDAGEILMDGRPQSRRRDPQAIGLVPQDLAVYPDLTVQQNLEVFGRVHQVSRADLGERVEGALEWTRLADRRRSLVGTLSGGMKRRLNLACGCLHEPRTLLLDEPTVAVDPQSRERIFEMLAELRQSGTSILLTTHQLDEVERRCDRVAVIDHGRIIAEGTFDALVASTIGDEFTVEIRLHEDTDVLPNGFTRSADDRLMLTRRLERGLEQLGPALHELEAEHCRVERCRVEGPTLHRVFLHLTGRDLRE